MTRIIVFFYCLISLSQGAYCQNIPSPEAYLGYPLGSRFSRYGQITGYFGKIAQEAPDRVKLEQYGETYEGRPLLLAYVSTPENLGRLESIRLNNLRLAGIVRDGVKPDEGAPAIVWLSYNVHGNEPSSSEAAMRTLYALLDPARQDTKEWLQHTVVLIDPCLNPDGRERYVNWYTMVGGRRPNPDPQSREHQEPWPGGRGNHYNFDLNRDWAWQTQIETQQRMKKYNAWLPQVHVDFHEQGYNDPYYFAPAAEPYHEVITPWQKQFQVMIGKNNAKYFDKQGWLYFTKEEFDLFYPSYGDTYPIYNGAIGMTFEQAGHSAGGLSVITADQDTLTLAQRIDHHFTASLSVIEMTAGQSARLVREFRKYFADAQTAGAGEARSWIIKDDRSDKLDRLKDLLDRNGILWTPLTGSGSLTGVDHQTGKPVSFYCDPEDILVKANQPKSYLLKVLFERKSRLNDSVTYDITAWSLPYAYGLQTYEVSMPINLSGGHENPVMSTGPVVVNPDSKTAYAYVSRWTGVQSAKFLAQLLQAGVKVRFAGQPFETGGLQFERGSLIIVKPGGVGTGPNLDTLVTGTARRTGAKVWPVASGFVDKGEDFGSSRVRMIHRPRIAMLTGAEVNALNAGEVWHFFEQELDYPVSLINADDLGDISWKDYDVVIMPDGEYKFTEDKNLSDQLKNWVKQGGRLIAMGNAVARLAKAEWGIRQKGDSTDAGDADGAKKEADYSRLRKYADRERHEASRSVPGSIYRVELDNSHPLAFGYPDHYYTLKQDDRVYEFIKEEGWNVGVIKKDNYVSGFTGSKAKEKLKDGLIFGVQEMGKGKIVYMADDPLFRSFWENGKLLFCNAVFLVGQ